MASNAPAVKKFKIGETIMAENEPGTEAYLITKGFVSVWKTEGSQRVAVGTRREGELIGEMALIDDTTHSATVTAESDVETIVITPTALNDLLACAPEPIESLVHGLFECLRTSNDLIGMHASRPPAKDASAVD